MRFFKKPYLIIITLILSLAAYNCSTSTSSNSGDSDTDPPPKEFNSQAQPGDSAASYLQSDQYTSLQIEIDYMQGYEPTQEALNSLETFLQNRLNKSSITFNISEIPARNEGPYSTSDIDQIEDEVRDNYTEAGSNTLHAHFLIVDGEFEQSNVLGIAYWNTSMALFGEAIASISDNPPVTPSRQQVEGTVFRHEVGHNLGLVGIGSPHPSGQQSHQDGSHCTVDGCLIQASVRTGDIFQNFSGEVPELDALCIEDLQANGGK
ncbi:MAG: zinc-dependent metalloprotease family protein [Balneolaceae bacterium]|nr:zinc-dependent metalloprotease family protein [Balneolaceae bacterium]